MSIRRTVFVCVAVVMLLSTVAASPASAVAPPPIIPGHLSYPAGGTTAIGAGTDSADQNAQLADSIGPRIKPSWHAEPALCPASGESDASSITVVSTRTVVVDRQYQCSSLSGYDTATGRLIWRRNYHFAHTAKIDGAVVYIEHDDPDGSVNLDAVDVLSGALRWTAYDGDDYGKYSTSIGSGLIMSNLWADDPTNGAHKFTVTLRAPAITDGTTFIAGGRIFYNADRATQAYSITNGALLWSYAKQGGTFGPGSGNGNPSLHNGLLYVPSEYGQSASTTIVLDPSTGKLIRTLPRSDQPIAFDGNVGIFTRTDPNSPSVISAVNLSTGAVYWNHSLPVVGGVRTELLSTSVVENGLVWILGGRDSGTPGQLAALDEVTGVTRALIAESCPAVVGNLVIAQHRIFAPSACGVLTYVAS